ncbi:MAG: NupC/NupG family nucleoside CNT transporter [Sphingomonadales bacterium]
MDYLQQIVGFIVLLLAGALFSTNIRKIKLSFIVNAIFIQFTLAFILIKLPIITQLFETISKVVITLKYATNQGTAFVFGYLADGAPNAPFAITEPTNTFIFAFGGLTLVIVISALSALLWHWRIIPPIVNALSVLFKRPLNVGGPLGLSATANIIFGQIETPLLVKPYLSSMSRRELLILMTVGMATISGSIMVVLTTFLNDLYGPALIGHFLIASIISVPAAIMYGNIMIPEDYKTEFPDSSTSNLYSNSMDAITTGTTNGLNIFMNIIGLIIVVIAFITLINITLSSMPDFLGSALSLERISGWVFSPIAWCMGIPWGEAQVAGELLGVKIIFNELIAYVNLAQLAENQLSSRSGLIMLYALCGFANLGSVGMLLSGIGSMAPEIKDDLVAVSGKALVGATLASCMTGYIVGVI